MEIMTAIVGLLGVVAVICIAVSIRFRIEGEVDVRGNLFGRGKRRK
jgi:hypothetical protein